jgi:hypothetical protein
VECSSSFVLKSSLPTGYLNNASPSEIRASILSLNALREPMSLGETLEGTKAKQQDFVLQCQESAILEFCNMKVYEKQRCRI